MNKTYFFRCKIHCQIYLNEEGSFIISKNKEFNISNVEIILSYMAVKNKEFVFYGDKIRFSLKNVLIKYLLIYLFIF